MHLIISCSLNENSKSRIMAEYALSLLPKNSEFIDLKEITLPLCDGDKCYSDPIVDKMKKYISEAKSIIIAGPIYNYDLNAAAKNLIELTGRSWSNKVVGFILAAGGKGSYMSALSFMNSLMLDFRCIIIPRFVYSDSGIDSEIENRIKELVDLSITISDAVKI